jgi:hypothetical protein
MNFYQTFYLNYLSDMILTFHILYILSINNAVFIYKN